MIIFNGRQFAAKKEELLLAKILEIKKASKKVPKVGCLVFFEDQGGIVYSQEKKQVAKRLGIEYEIIQTSLSQDRDAILQPLIDFVNDPTITGIIIQKPWRKNWEVFHEEFHSMQDFQDWWQSLTQYIPASKDIDGLTPDTLSLIKAGKWEEKGAVLPATCRAVLSILEEAGTQLQRNLSNKKMLIIGRSDLLGTPLFYELKNQGYKDVQLVGQKEFETMIMLPSQLEEFSTIISSTGIKNLITEDMIEEGCLIIDAGFPEGDVEFRTVSEKSAFITPVPNGVGPVTVISLLENVVELCYNSHS